MSDWSSGFSPWEFRATRTPRSRGSFQRRAFILLGVRAFLSRWWERSDEHVDKSRLSEQFKTQAKVEGQWTVFGLAKATGGPPKLAVHPDTPRNAAGNSPQRHRTLLDRR
jgi:hypothetical protein